MSFLIENVLWINPGDEYSSKKLSLRLQNGVLIEFGAGLEPFENEERVNGEGFSLSPGWIDLVARNGAPANPHNESMDSLFQAAASGGFTKIMIQPDTVPAIQTIESVSYFKNHISKNGVEILVSASSTVDNEGKKMAEMLRLSKVGADSFSMVHSIHDSGFFGRLLKYLQHCGKVLLDQPSEPSLSAGKQMNEGIVGGRRGLAGNPAEAEWLIVDRDITMLKYAGGKLHLSCLSTPEAVEKVWEAKSSGLDISCSLAANQLAFNEEALDQFDTNHKVWPPYRDEEKRKGLIRVLQEGKVDAIVSNHSPWHYDFKDVEFENAEFGISSLETSFSSLVHFGGLKDEEKITALLFTRPNQILNREKVALQKGMKADFTLFSTQSETKFEIQNWQSKSKNSPFIGETLSGVVAGVFTQKGFFQNPHFLKEIKYNGSNPVL